ncbi:uncharacterized protein LOC125205216 [Salvia hispanica]|uniref:uncharacterized protein LOC125205216 n=1 Tax=Salvia hispanica TaxID=49212 RepID=UPI002009AC58|nr:uncharacterized protein LOC125205216 [Salvia hispanica]
MLENLFSLPKVKRMKLVAFALVALISFLCLAAHQRALVGSRRDDVMMKTNQVDRNIDNHHNIPRQYYNQWGSGGDNNGDNNANEDLSLKIEDETSRLLFE